MTQKYVLSVFVLSFFVVGCASVPQSHDLSSEAVSKVPQARVVVIAPGASSLASGTRFDAEHAPVAGLPAPGLTPLQAVTPAGIVGGAIAAGLIGALVGADAQAQRRESLELLAREGHIPSQEYARSVAQREFTALASRQTPMRITDVVMASSSSEGAVESARGASLSAVMQFLLRQTMSVDLSRLRIHVRARLIGPGGAELMDQNVFYLPVSIPGVTKEEALGNWKHEDYRLYRDHVEKGIAGAVDAMNALAFSKLVNDPESFPDGGAMLKRTSCFGGDYDAGIPMSAYQGGRILPTRSGITAIKLQNGDVLVFPRCET
ncbi:hypothetical protein [Ramlibacter alkalitolerans]|uniref:Lipoprotein n=1 Tax=Ramlibacter alkalitolerans TaxID=2039631 RepID=A0ABS1JR70_9BURK|nr:hypothetical protein [Ramlibacter alkalitolerans]MBL0426713.1 hypothetical protein [Ramlibacter alkalitolerans]